eukprot:g58590.t1
MDLDIKSAIDKLRKSRLGGQSPKLNDELVELPDSIPGEPFGSDEEWISLPSYSFHFLLKTLYFELRFLYLLAADNFDAQAH